MKTVRVQIKDGYHGHEHLGKEVFPGDVIEVTPTQAAWLHRHGVTVPVIEKKSSKKASAVTETPEEAPADGAEDAPIDSQSHTDEV